MFNWFKKPTFVGCVKTRDAGIKPCIKLTLCNGIERWEAEFAIDTGFSGDLMLDRATIEHLKLHPETMHAMRGADGKLTGCQHYEGSVMVGRELRPVVIGELPANALNLVGMRFLTGFEVRFRAALGAMVSVL